MRELQSTIKNVGPPRPKLAVRVGVTGHRPNGLHIADMNMLQERVQEVLSYIKENVEVIYSKTNTYYAGLEPVFRLISPLAEGADRIVAHEALELGYELQCPLPFEHQQYEKDFQVRESKDEFRNLLEQATTVLEINGGVADKESAYYSVGKMVLTQCDILIAIWDGKESRGLGGTAQIVEEARSYIIPTIWIKAQKPHNICLVNSSEDWKTYLVQHLQSTLKPEDSITDMAQTYFTEKQRNYNPGFPYKLFRDLVGDGKFSKPNIRLPDFEESTKTEWQSEIWDKSKEFSSKMKYQIETAFMKYYAWADKLADYYANLYRTSFLTTYIFSGLAVLCALLSYAMQSSHVIWPVITEVLLIFCIITVIYLGNKYRWHERWIDYRMLAEILRTMKFLAPLGQVAYSFRVPAHASVDDIRSSWVIWYFNAVVREAGLMDIKIDNPQGNWTTALKYYQDSFEIRQQLVNLVPDNADYRRGLSISYEKLGDVEK